MQGSGERGQVYVAEKLHRCNFLRARSHMMLQLGHPLRLAEDVATLDHLTHGRLEFCWMNVCSRLTQKQVLRSMRRFAAEVMPAFPRN